VPATAYLRVVQNYNLPHQSPRTAGPYSLTYDVTDKKVIARLAAMISALPVAPDQNIAVPCASSMGPAYELDFRDSKTAPDTSGAGDIFHGAFCFYACEPGATFQDALAKAAVVASESCRHIGTRAWMRHWGKPAGAA